MKIRAFLSALVDDFRVSLKVWPAVLAVSVSLAYLTVIRYLTNQHSIFTGQKIYLVAPLAAMLFLLLSLAVGRFVLPRLAQQPRKNWAAWLLVSLVLGLILMVPFPVPLPALNVHHTLVISTAGSKNVDSTAALVEIKEIKYLTGKNVPLEKLKLTGNWQTVGNSLVSDGKPPASITLDGDVPGGVLLSIKHGPDSGMVTVEWDGWKKEMDLFTPEGTILNTTLRGFSFRQLSAGQNGLLLASIAFYLIGLTALAFILLLVFALPILRPHFGLQLAIYLGVFALFLIIKLKYPDFSAPRVFRDTTSYVNTAVQPITSLTFWAGERPFTIPLIYKLLRINLQNFNQYDGLSRAASFQSWFSTACWTLLGLALAKAVRKRWLGPLALGGVLFYSLSLEVGLWDSLLLSESITFSLFALLLAAWIGWLQLPEKIARSFWGYLSIVGILLVSTLYCFTRDSNFFFLLIGAAVFALAALLKKGPWQKRAPLWIYSGAVLLLVLVNYLSLGAGNRWQIFMYDHLAMRILRDPPATAYFEQAGLPVSDELMKITTMVGYEYHDLLINSPDFGVVRTWVNQSSKQAYIAYLLSDPLGTLWAPIAMSNKLVNGSNQEYLYPKYLAIPLPERMLILTQIFYPHEVWALLLLGGLALLGSAFYWFGKHAAPQSWLVISILLISVYPLMFLVWHGEPMEIERHAAQIGLQVRLAGWMGLLLGLDWLASQEKLRRWFQCE